MVESIKRTIDRDHLDEVVDTSSVVISAPVRDEVNLALQEGRLVITEGTVFVRAYELGVFTGTPGYEINLNGGYFVIKPNPQASLSESIIVPINLEPLAFLRELLDWKPPTPKKV